MTTEISTHTLTWSVTDKRTKQARYKHISTHTLTWSVTKNVVDMGKQILDFNSHAHVERDSVFFNDNSDNEISTHTLTWSVTLKEVLQLNEYRFQLTRSRGA